MQGMVRFTARVVGQMPNDVEKRQLEDHLKFNVKILVANGQRSATIEGNYAFDFDEDDEDSEPDQEWLEGVLTAIFDDRFDGVLDFSY